MRVIDFLSLVGFKAKIKEYGFELVSVNLPTEGNFQLAQWLHPMAGKMLVFPDEIESIKKFLKPGDVAIDIGAYTGDTAIPMAIVTGGSGAVLALEPNKHIFKVLEKNAELIREKGNIIPLPFAATPEDCTMNFEYSDSGFCNGGYHEGISKWKHGHAHTLEVEGKNLEKFLHENYSHLISRIKYIKVDAEGYDCTVLESLATIIEKQKPYLRVEVFKHSELNYRKRLYYFLKKYNYQIYYFGGTANYKGQLIEECDLMKWHHYDMFAIPQDVVE
ncbi:MAG: FkbM family methyltransferase [Chitinophagaceae bacterium]|nr:MAG: FkbM family methyltransferase [Chitinophagaceae bacterium]